MYARSYCTDELSIVVCRPMVSYCVPPSYQPSNNTHTRTAQLCSKAAEMITASKAVRGEIKSLVVSVQARKTEAHEKITSTVAKHIQEARAEKVRYSYVQSQHKFTSWYKIWVKNQARNWEQLFVSHAFTEKLSCGFLWICRLVFTVCFFLGSETFSWSRAKCGWPKTPSVTRNTMRRLLWGWPWDPSQRNTGKRHFPFARNVAGHSMTLTTVLHLHILVHI